MDFSRALAALMAFSGKATSINFFLDNLLFMCHAVSLPLSNPFEMPKYMVYGCAGVLCTASDVVFKTLRLPQGVINVTHEILCNSGIGFSVTRYVLAVTDSVYDIVTAGKWCIRIFKMQQHPNTRSRESRGPHV